MQGKCDQNQVDNIGVPILKAFVYVAALGVERRSTKKNNEEKKEARSREVAQKKQKQNAMASTTKKPPPDPKETGEESKEEIAEHLGGANPLIVTLYPVYLSYNRVKSHLN